MEEKKQIRVIEEDESPDDRVLVVRTRNGDKSAFGLLVRKYQLRVLRMVMAMIGDLETAKDIVQESFIRAYQNLDRFMVERPFYPWLSKIATNLTLNHIKRGGREVSMDDETTAPAVSHQDNPLDKLQANESDKRFMAAVNKLPEQYRVVFVLRNFEDLGYSEIAERLEISIGTVDSRIYRARRILMEELKDLLN